MRFIERFLLSQYELDNLYEEARYTPARTVGTARVKNIFSYGEKPLFDIVILDLKVQEGDRSREISRVPVGLFKKGDIAEVVVREYKGSFIDPRSWMILGNGGFCVVAIRPFSPSTYGKPIDPLLSPYQEMLERNGKGPHFAPAFYEKFRLQRGQDL